ncbi:MAG: Fic family protein [bacterium]|nr:Fic family protein [bacterium]
MRPDAFRSTERGTVRMTLGGFRAFYPNPLPRRLDLPQEVVRLSDEATGAVHRLGGLGRLLPNPHLLIGPHLRLEAVQSSRIEGTRADIPQLLRLEAGETPGETDDAQEVRNYVIAMEYGLDRVRDGFPISTRLLREIHERLLSGVRGQHRLPGEFRQTPNWIRGTNLDNAVFVPPPPEAMGELLTDLEYFLHEQEMPLLIQLALAHYQFEVIHPFLDGNGRIGRLMIPLMLILRGALTQPLLYLSAYFEHYRDDYFDLLLSTSQNGDLLPWIQFFLRGVQQQARDAEERTVRLVDLHHQVRSELLDEKRPNSVVRLAEHLFNLPFVTAKWAADTLEVSPPTAYSAINSLVERGDLVELGERRRNRIYQAPHIFEAVYGSPPQEDTAE